MSLSPITASSGAKTSIWPFHSVRIYRNSKKWAFHFGEMSHVIDLTYVTGIIFLISVLPVSLLGKPFTCVITLTIFTMSDLPHMED